MRLVSFINNFNVAHIEGGEVSGTRRMLVTTRSGLNFFKTGEKPRIVLINISSILENLF